MVKNPPASAGDTGLIPGSGNPLEKGMATHSSILAWEIPWTEEPGRLQSNSLQRVSHDRNWVHIPTLKNLLWFFVTLLWHIFITYESSNEQEKEREQDSPIFCHTERQPPVWLRLQALRLGQAFGGVLCLVCEGDCLPTWPQRFSWVRKRPPEAWDLVLFFSPPILPHSCASIQNSQKAET